MQLNTIETPFVAPTSLIADTIPPCALTWGDPEENTASNSFCALIEKMCEADLIRKRHRFKSARLNICRAGEVNEGFLIISEGWAVRFAQLPNGKRQNLSVVLPGEVVSASSVFDRKSAFSVQAITDVRYSHFEPEDIRAGFQRDPDLLNAWGALVSAEHRNADDQLVDLGQRSAQERIAAIILRIVEQFGRKGNLKDRKIPFPLRQQHIAELAGLTPVHVCRVLSSLRQEGICDIAAGIARIVDLDGLRRMAAARSLLPQGRLAASAQR